MTLKWQIIIFDFYSFWTIFVVQYFAKILEEEASKKIMKALQT